MLEHLQELFWQFFEHVSHSEPLQALLIGAGTWFFEDGVTLGASALVMSGDLNWCVATIALTIGIALGDTALYLTGRFASHLIFRRNWIKRQRLIRYELFFADHMAKAVFLARFIPGTRTLTFLAAGILRASFFRFLLLAFLASLAQTLLVVGVAYFLGDIARGLITNNYVKLALGLLAITLIIAMNYKFIRRRKQQEEALGPELQYTETPFASFEFWPPWFFYIPTFLHYFWLSLRHRSLRLPLNSNPAIYASGLENESKIQIYDLLNNSPACKPWLAPVTSIPPRPGQSTTIRFNDARAALQAANLPYPVVAKPDIGQRGVGVRRIRDDAELLDYLNHYPLDQPLIFQYLIPHPHEAGILYVRFPDAAESSIPSFAIKEFPFVTGDGRHSIRELILADTRKQRISDRFFKKLKNRLGEILPAGEKLQLVFTGNHAQGAIFWDRNRDLTPELADRFRELGDSLDGVYYARIDVRYRDYETFLKGQDFLIVELNGAGAEPIHMYDPHRKLSETYAILRWWLNTLFEIGRQNLRRGSDTMITLRQFLRDMRAVRKLVNSYPPSE